MQRKKLLFAAASTALALGTAWGAQAQITEYDIGINPTYQQTGPTTVASTGGFFAARVFLTNAGDFDGGTVTVPGTGAMLPLTPQPGVPATLAYGIGDSSLSDLNATFPMGTYAFDVTNSVTSDSQSLAVDYSVNADSLSIPTLTASSFNALQDLHAGAGVDIDFNAFLQNPDASAGLIFLNITDHGGDSLFSEVVDPGVTSVFLPGGTLAAGTTYNFDLNFDERITGSDPMSGIDNTIFFDTHTDGTFTTAIGVPEPATWAMMLIGFGGLGAAMRQRRRVVAAAC